MTETIDQKVARLMDMADKYAGCQEDSLSPNRLYLKAALRTELAVQGDPVEPLTGEKNMNSDCIPDCDGG